MVCNRCIVAMKAVLSSLNIEANNISLGEVELAAPLSPEQLEAFKKQLEGLGFEIIDDRKSRIIEHIKRIIIELVHQQDNDFNEKLSDVLSRELHHDYNYLSNIFSEVEGSTIEKYYIAQKIERVKELLVYDELSLSEIAYQLNYSSVAYLSNQFKKITSLTPSHFKNIGNSKRKPLDKV
ncbi:MAG TPA: AraC family transcriptional regulator [Edaphocola sp.]|nr:AraC family transcriptional regulator [Edaphocola sp.]